MHEASIAEGILKTALEAMNGQGSKITKISVVAGVLAGVERDCLAMYFDLVAKGTAAEGAELSVTPETAKLVCGGCGAQAPFDASGPVEVTCRGCGGANRLTGGDALYIDSIEVDE